MSAGIDYGFGRTNVDRETGIRYGVISQGAILQAWSDSSEADYGQPTCPKCGGQVHADGPSEGFEQYEDSGCADYLCADCELTIDSSDCFGEEPIGWNVDADGYKMTDCLDSNVMILESPYFTYAPFCSPCVPGAGNLDNASEGELDETDGVKTYCAGHDWFEDGFAPYPVYDVAAGAIVPRPPTQVFYGAHCLGGTYLYAHTGDILPGAHHRACWIVPGTLDPTL